MKLTTKLLRKIIREETDKLQGDLEKAKNMLDVGAISKDQFEKVKANVLKGVGLEDQKLPKDAQNILGGDKKTAAAPQNPLSGGDPLGGDTETAAAPGNPLGGGGNPLAGDTKTAAAPQNPLSGDRETATPDNPQGTPLKQRVANIEKILKQLVAKAK